jgi:hypothetical protein
MRVRRDHVGSSLVQSLSSCSWSSSPRARATRTLYRITPYTLNVCTQLQWSPMMQTQSISSFGTGSEGRAVTVLGQHSHNGTCLKSHSRFLTVLTASRCWANRYTCPRPVRNVCEGSFTTSAVETSSVDIAHLSDLYDWRTVLARPAATPPTPSLRCPLWRVCCRANQSHHSLPGSE